MNIEKLESLYKQKAFPYVNIDKNIISKEIHKLENMQTDQYLQKSNEELLFPGGFSYKGRRILNIKNVSTGNLISNYYFQKQRMKASMGKHQSPLKIWNNKEKRKRVFKGVLTLYKNQSQISDGHIRSAIRLYYSMVPQFKVGVAKVIFDLFQAQHVLDFSAGWGDRLAAFLFTKTCKSYVGIDPNIQLRKPYERLISALNINKKDVNMIFRPAEEVEYKPQFKYDLIFTSPPYFDLEKYSNDASQSNNKYSNIHEWLHKFLFQALRNNLKYLDGILALQISDYVDNGKKVHIVEPLQHFMKTEYPQFKYKGFVTISTKGRFNKLLFEPLFIWKNVS